LKSRDARLIQVDDLATCHLPKRGGAHLALAAVVEKYRAREPRVVGGLAFTNQVKRGRDLVPFGDDAEGMRDCADGIPQLFECRILFAGRRPTARSWQAWSGRPDVRPFVALSSSEAPFAFQA